jgi:hypothetical protein
MSAKYIAAFDSVLFSNDGGQNRFAADVLINFCPRLQGKQWLLCNRGVLFFFFY